MTHKSKLVNKTKFKYITDLNLKSNLTYGSLYATYNAELYIPKYLF